MIETIEVLEDTVYDINQDIYDSTVDTDKYYNLILKSDGYSKSVEFCGFCLWDSENEDRDWDEEFDCYAPPIGIHLRNKLNNILGTLKNINVNIKA